MACVKSEQHIIEKMIRLYCLKRHRQKNPVSRLPGTSGLCSGPPGAMSFSGFKIILQPLSGPLLQTGNAKTRAGGNAFFRPPDAFSSSCFGG